MLSLYGDEYAVGVEVFGMRESVFVCNLFGE